MLKAMEPELDTYEAKFDYKNRNYEKMDWAIAHLDKKLSDPANRWDPRSDSDLPRRKMATPSWDPQSDYDRLNLKNLREEKAKAGNLETYMSDEFGSA